MRTVLKCTRSANLKCTSLRPEVHPPSETTTCALRTSAPYDLVDSVPLSAGPLRGGRLRSWSARRVSHTNLHMGQNEYTPSNRVSVTKACGDAHRGQAT